MNRRHFIQLAAAAPLVPVAAKLPALKPVWEIAWGDIVIAPLKSGAGLSHIVACDPCVMVAMGAYLKSEEAKLRAADDRIFG